MSDHYHRYILPHHQLHPPRHSGVKGEKLLHWYKFFDQYHVIAIIIVIINHIIILTRAKQAYGWQGLAGVSLCASSSQLGG